MKNLKFMCQSKAKDLMEIIDRFSAIETRARYERVENPSEISKFLAYAHTAFEDASNKYDSEDDKFFSKYVERVEAIVKLYSPNAFKI
ncbi:MAG: hypothetical protein WC781_04870 [Candidatus Pacearchaeota archaeon]|jgi:hypothetical protein